MRYKAVIEYDGGPYIGFQVQPDGKSIQGTLQKALKTISKGHNIGVHGSGRTDSGVHAKGQVIHFDYPAAISTHGLWRALNSVTPDSIRIKEVEAVEETFHARYHTIGKRYEYHVDLAKYPSPFTAQYMLHHPYSTDVDRMQTALNDLIGTHDFKSFCSTKTDKTDFVRTLTQAQVDYDAENHHLTFTFAGDGFLYNMVRILVGTALQIGDGLRPVDEMQRLLAVKDRNEAGPTAPAHGLYLMAVDYMDRADRDAKVAIWEDHRR